MKVRPYQLQSLYAVVIALAFAATAMAQHQNSTTQLAQTSVVRFTENRGQISSTLGDLRPDILYTASSSNVKVFFRSSGLSYVFYRISAPARRYERPDQFFSDNSATITSYRMDMDLVGANPRPVVAPEEQSNEFASYYSRRFPNGITDIKNFSRLVYQNVYPNIDLVFYGNGNGLKYDFVVRPGGNVADIRIRYTGAENINTTSRGTVVATNPLGTIEEGKIFSYQTGAYTAPRSDAGGQSPVQSTYTLGNGVISFNIPFYDRTKPLVIDPPVMWSTYCGGSNNDLNVSWNHGSTVVDNNRNVLITGSAASVDFPVTVGAFQTIRMGPNYTYDAYVAKFSANGARKWATYFGGSSSDNSYGIATDRAGNVIFAGTTYSYDFPTTPGAYRSMMTSYNDGFIVKLDSNGHRLWSTYYPNGGCYAIGTDRHQNILVGGQGWANMPTTPNAFQRAINGSGSDAFVAKFTMYGTMLWSTYYGGSGQESIGGITTDADANVLVSGYTSSPNFPVSEEAFQGTLAGGIDAFLLKFDSNGQRSWATYFGGTSYDYGYGITTDQQGDIVMAGYTESTDLPTNRDASQPKSAGMTDAFIAQFGSSKGNRVWASYFGGKSTDLAYNVAVDGRGNVWIAGYTYSSDLPLPGDAYKLRPANEVAADAMVAQFDQFGVRMWSSYLGGSNDDYATGIATSEIGVVVTGNTLSLDIPTTDGAFQANNAGSYDAFITQFCNVTVSTISVKGPIVLCQGDSTVLSAPEGFQSYLWSNGETGREIVVRQSGWYRVTLGVGGCDGVTDAVQIVVHPKPRRVIGVIGAPHLCASGGSVVLTLGSGLRGYRWSTGETTQAIAVREPGTYSATFIDANGCPGISDTFVVTRHPKPSPSITVEGDLDFCEGGGVTLSAGDGYSQYQWSNGELTPTIVAVKSGLYTVRVANDVGCWAESKPVRVIVRPRPSFRIASLLPTAFCHGDSTILTASEELPSYRWSTGDTTRTITVREPGIYTLTGTNAGNCSAVASVIVQTVPDPSPTITASRPPRICLGETVVLDAGEGYKEYLWNTGQRSQRLVVSEPGRYSVTVTNSLGCSGVSNVIEVDVVERPSATFSGASTVCPGATTVYTAPEMSAKSYSWDVSGAGGKIIAGGSTNSITVRWDGQGIGMVRLETRVPGSDCAADTSMTVDVGSAMVPVIAANGSTAICPGGNVVLDAGEGYSRYEWTNGARTRTIIVTDADPGDYSVTVTTTNGCTGTSLPVEVSVAEPPAPSIMALGSTAFCAGDSVILDAGEGYTSYLWSNRETTRRITAHTADAYFVLVTNRSGCSAVSPEVRTEITASPSPRIAGPGVVCDGLRVIYSAPQVKGHQYTWQSKGGTIISGQGTSMVLVEWNSTGTLDLIQKSESGACVGEAPTAIVQVADRLQPTITTDGPTAICEGQSVVLDAGPGFDAYRWSNGARTQTITVTDAGQYMVDVTGGGCSGSSLPVTITARELPLPAIAAAGPTEFCEGESVSLRASEGFSSYLWSNGARTREITVDKSGTYTVIAGDDQGCSAASTEITVKVHPIPSRPNIRERGSELVAPNADGYTWRHNGTVMPRGNGQSVIARQEGVYTVTIRNAGGCEATSEPFYRRNVITVLPHAVRLDTASEHVGNRFHITMHVTPALSQAEGISGYRAWVRIPRRSLFVHRVISPDAPMTGEPATVQHMEYDSYLVERSYAGQMLSGGQLFQLELEGLSTGVPVNDLTVDSVVFIGGERPTLAANGLVILSGCDVGRDFDFNKRARIQAIRPNPVSHEAAIVYRAPSGSVPVLRLISTTGQEVFSMPLPAGSGEDQETRLDLGIVASGVYTLELRDGNELSTMPLVIRK